MSFVSDQRKYNIVLEDKCLATQPLQYSFQNAVYACIFKIGCNKPI